MMTRHALATALIAAAAFVGQAWAQSSLSAAPGTSTARGSAQEVATDAELQSFARATIKLHSLNKPALEEQNAAITAAGLSVARYNEIAARMQSDPAFQSRVNTALADAQQKPTGQAAAEQAKTAPPALPTEGPGATVLTLLEKVCLPMVRQDVPLSTIGPKAGLKFDKKTGTYIATLGQAPFAVSVLPRGANQTVCNVQIRHPLDSGEAIATALNVWTMHQVPEMRMVRNDAGVGADGLKRTTLSWEQSTDSRAAALVFVRTQRPDGAPIENGVGSASLLYSERPS